MGWQKYWPSREEQIRAEEEAAEAEMFTHGVGDIIEQTDRRVREMGLPRVLPEDLTEDFEEF